MQKRNFTAEVDGKEVSLLIRSPSIQDQREAGKVYNQAFSDAIKSKAIVRAKIDEILKEQGLWDDQKQSKLDTLQAQILERERGLAKGGISLSTARTTALEMKKLREEIRDLISVKTTLDNNTAEGQADNARFNYLVSACTVYQDNNKPYFSNMEDYLAKSIDDVGLKAAQTLANMIYGLDNNYESNLPENKFLKQYKFIDDKLRLINNEGKLIDKDGRLIDEHGRYVDDGGNFVDKYGYRVDEAGKYVIESQPFLDDNGKPIILEESKKDEPVVSTPVDNKEETKVTKS
jgi:hypothetical protein